MFVSLEDISTAFIIPDTDNVESIDVYRGLYRGIGILFNSQLTALFVCFIFYLFLYELCVKK